MSFLKKINKVLGDTATKITKTKDDLTKVYEKDSWVGLMDIAEKKIDNFNEATNTYIDNLKTVNEKVINETAKNSNSSFEAIWKSTFAVSKETFTFIGRDLKEQAVKMYKAWEGIEVEHNFSPEMNLLFQASAAVKPEELMKYCGATREGAIFTLNNVQVEIYGEIWFDVAAPDKRFSGALPLLQHVILHATEEFLSDEMLLRNCLSIMYKLPEVKEAYNVLYAEYLTNNPSIVPLDSPFDVRETNKVTSEVADAVEETVQETVQEKPFISNELKAGGAELLTKIKDGTSDYLQKGKSFVNDLSDRYGKMNLANNLEIQKEVASDKPPFLQGEGAANVPDLAEIQKEVAKLEKLKAEIEEANKQKSDTKAEVKVKPARKTAAGETKAKPARKTSTVKATDETKAKPARKTATAKDVGETKIKPARKTVKAKDVTEK